MRIGPSLALALLMPLAGCISMGRPGTGFALPVSAGVAELGDGLIGRSPALKLSASARSKALDAEYQALQFSPAGQPVAWEETGIQGSVVPTQLYRVGSQDCRGYSHTVTGGGRETKTVGAACRTEAGLWKTVS